ncbi:MAG: 2-C-methyl-D-erythritol 2,4-cyclodiphosphate synthase [Tropheryma whipplei]|nr:2-C-methyl-D-erythritol 2,4-cyclodiphosphate synthase [Tropheryma whipplei]
MAVGLLLLAAGVGSRLSSSLPKAFVSVGGLDLIQWCLKNLGQLRTALEVVVTVPKGFVELCERNVLQSLGTLEKIKIVTGGATRQDSVGLGIRCFSARITKLLVHDVARAFTPPEIYLSVIKQLETSKAVIPVIAIVDSIKKVNMQDAYREVARGPGEPFHTKSVLHLDRREFFSAQTPQGFDRALLEAAHERSVASNEQFADDSVMVAQIEKDITLINGHEASFKVTNPCDLQRAEFAASSLLSKSNVSAVNISQPPISALSMPLPLIGVGIDFHKFILDESPLFLACLEWKNYRRLQGHSDGDVVAHACTTALLSAANMGDIGSVFGVDLAATKDASGAYFLESTNRLLATNGFCVLNIAVQVISNTPRLADRRVEAEHAISDCLSGARISLSSVTTDGMGFLGRGEGIGAIAVAQIYHR